MSKQQAKKRKAKHNDIKQKLESKKINVIKNSRVEDAREQLSFIHSQNKDDNCYVAIATKNNPKKFEQWHVKSEELDWNRLSNLLGFNDLYISVSSSWRCSRKLRDIRRLNAFWVDLDYYNISKYKHKTTEEMINILRKNGMFKDLEPSFFIDSGNGMYVFYLIESCPKQMLSFWQTIQDKLCKEFETYGADSRSTDAVHVLRLAGSINSKTDRVARLIYNSDSSLKFIAKQEQVRRHQISEVGEKLLPPLQYTKKEWQKIKKERKKNKKQSKKDREARKVYTFMNLHTLHYKRMCDIEKLIKLRDGNCKSTRELMCFLYRYFSCCYYKDPHNALEAITELNNSFKESLAESELINATSSAETAFELWKKTYEEYTKLDKETNVTQFFRKAGCYIYSNKKLIELLNISQEEMQHLETIINTKEKNRRSKDYRSNYYKENSEKYNKYRREKRRNENGLTQREQEKLEKMQQVDKLLKKGTSKVAIAKEVGISRMMVYKYIDEINLNKENKIINQQNINDSILDVNEMFTRVDTTDIQAIIC